MKLEDKMNKYKTKRRPNCESCGNPWFFQKESVEECTMCHAERAYETKAQAQEAKTHIRQSFWRKVKKFFGAK